MSFKHSLLTGHPDQIDSTLVPAGDKRFLASDFWESEKKVVLRLGSLLDRLEFLLGCFVSEISFPVLFVISLPELVIISFPTLVNS